MEIRLLGPVELVSAGGPVPIGSEKQRALLAFLALRPQRLVTNDALVDGLWGDDPPDGAVKALRFHVSRLRGVLRQADAADTLRTRPRGYLLAIAEDAVDVVRFERSVAEARLARSDGAAPDAVSSALRDALALWTGPALADINAEPFVSGERRRLEELRLAATEDFFAAELAGGRHAEAVGELERMVDGQPLRERLWELLITALYRSGRQADALAAYQRVRRILADELGIDPSAPLRQLEQRVLLQDPELAAPSTNPTPASGSNGEPLAAADAERSPVDPSVRPSRGLATSALAFGILGLGLFRLGVVSTVIAGLAVVCGTIAARRARPGSRLANSRATVGIVTGAVAFSASLGLPLYRYVAAHGDAAETETNATASTEPDDTDRTAPPGSRESRPLGRNVSIEAVEVGDCYNLPRGIDRQVQSGGLSTEEIALTVWLVPCDEPHEQELFHLFELPAGPYPGEAQVQAFAREQCTARFEEYVGVSPDRSELHFVYVWPSRTTWGQWIRKGGCALFHAVGDLTGSMVGTRR